MHTRIKWVVNMYRLIEWVVKRASIMFMNSFDGNKVLSGPDVTHTTITKPNGFWCNSEQIERIQQNALASLVQFANSFNLFRKYRGNHLIFIITYIGLLL